MDFDGTDATASLSADDLGLSPGDYTVNVRAMDNAGNWSSVASTTLTID
jgi:hypothetical protein